MATPKLDEIHVGLARRIRDVDSSQAAITNAATDGLQLTKNQRDTFINLALQKFFTDRMNIAFEGAQTREHAIDVLIAALPDLSDSYSGNTDNNAQLNFASIANNLDFYLMIEAIVGGVQCDIAMAKDYLSLDNDFLATFSPTTAEPVAIQRGQTITFYPENSFKSVAAKVNFIKYPIDPTDGNNFDQNGANDIPYSRIWIPQLIDLAYAIYQQDVGNNL